MTPELAPYTALAQELLRRVYAEEDAQMLNQWLAEQIGRFGGGADVESVLTWEQSFDLYEQILAQREIDAALPESERRALDWLWASWNQMIDPLEPGMLAVVSAGDGMGKTICAECLAEHWARRKNHVVFVHYELNRKVVLDRRTARHTGISRRELASGRLTPVQKQTIAAMKPRMLGWDGYISYVHTPDWTMERTTQKLRALKAEGKCDVVVLDYLEKNAVSRRQMQMFGGNQNQREADNVEQLKNFAESTETPVLMLAQMSKAGKTASADIVDRTGMRGAGEKSEKSNVVVLLHREKIDNGYSNMVDVIVDKNTLGATGRFTQMMEPEFFRLNDVEMERTYLNE